MDKKKMTSIGGGILVVAVIVMVVVSAGKKKAAKQQRIDAVLAIRNAAKPVDVETVRAIQLEKVRSYPGIIDVSEKAALSFRVGGPLTEVTVLPGQAVKKGDLLMQIDPRDFEDRIASLDAQMSGAVAVQKNATKDFERIKQLFEQSVVPQSNFDGATSNRDAADATVKKIGAELAIARHALKDTSLLAPFDGTVTGQNVENHEMVKAGQVVMNYHNIQTLEVQVSIPENEIVNLSVIGQNAAKVTLPSLPGKTLQARLKEWSSAADPMTRTYSVTFEFECPKGLKILPGMSAAVYLQKTAQANNVITVPVTALVPEDPTGTSLWIYNETAGTAERRAITTGDLSGTEDIIVTSGLSEGEQIVVSSSRLLADGASLVAVERR